MLKALTIIIFISITLASGSQVQKKKQPYQPKECTDISDIYTGYDSPNRSLEPSEEILSICPNLKDACCYKEGFYALHDVALDSIKKLEYFEQSYKKVLKMMTEVKDKNMKEFLAKWEVKLLEKHGYEYVWNEESGHSDDEPTRVPSSQIQEDIRLLKRDFKYLKDNKEIIERDLEDAIQFLGGFGSRYICALCTADYQSQFENFHKRKTTKKLRLDMSMCPLIFQENKAKAIFRLDYSTGRLYNIIIAMFDMRNGVGRRESFLSKDELANMSNLLKKCSKNKAYLTDESCNSICKSMGFWNKNIMAGIEKIIFAGELALPEALMGQKPMNEDEMNNKYQRTLTKYTMEVFMPPIEERRTGERRYPLERLEIVEFWGKGWNLMKYDAVLHDKYFLREEIKSQLKNYFQRLVESKKQNPSQTGVKTDALSSYVKQSRVKKLVV